MNKQRIIIDRMYQSFKDFMYDDVPAVHQKELIDFHKTQHGESSLQQDENFNQWFYQGNSSNKRYYCYRDEQVIGQQSAIEIELNINGKTIKAAYAIELMVRPEWKMKGLGVAMIGVLMNRYDVLIGLGVSDDAYKMFIRQGWLDLGTVNLFIKPLKYAGIRKRRVKTNLIKKAAYVAALVVSSVNDFYRHMMSGRGEFRKISLFTDVHEQIVNGVCESGVITANKTAGYFNWRFINFPEKGAYEAYELMEGDSPVAFFAVKMSDWIGSDVLLISEIYAKQSDLGKVIDKIVCLGKAENASMIIYQGLDEKIESKLKRRCFFAYPGGERLIVFTNAPELESKLKQKEKWRVCEADSDIDLFLDNDFY